MGAKSKNDVLDVQHGCEIHDNIGIYGIVNNKNILIVNVVSGHAVDDMSNLLHK